MHLTKNRSREDGKRYLRIARPSSLLRNPSIAVQQLSDHARSRSNSQPPAAVGHDGNDLQKTRSAPSARSESANRSDNLDLNQVNTRISNIAEEPSLPRILEDAPTSPNPSELPPALTPKGLEERRRNNENVFVVEPDPSDKDRQAPMSKDPNKKMDTWSDLFKKSKNKFLKMTGQNQDGVESEKPTMIDNKPYIIKEVNPQMVDMLDVVDPEIATLATLTNVQNSLFVPDLGGLLNRRPVYKLSTTKSRESLVDRVLHRKKSVGEPQKEEDGHLDLQKFEAENKKKPQRPPMDRLSTINSQMSDTRYAVLPHGVKLDDWSQEDKEELNDHVRHMLHSRRSKFMRGLRGFGQYVRRPLGFFITLYATLITLFGLAWVLFLIGWIEVGSKKLYVTNVIDNVLVALFAIMGDGLAPFRAVDTYHMIYIAHYHHLTWKVRKENELPKLQDHNDLPASRPEGSPDGEPDLEAHLEPEDGQEYTVLTPEQQRKLQHHQDKFAKSHTFYKPHETMTHYAFPLRLLVAVVVLLDCHSLFQIALGTCTWAIYYKVRPFALTTTILCCSIACNITAGILITIGDRKTRKTEVIEKMFRQELTQEAIEKIEQDKQKELEKLTKDDTPTRSRSSLDGLLHDRSKTKLSTHSKDSTDPAHRSSLHSQTGSGIPILKRAPSHGDLSGDKPVKE